MLREIGDRRRQLRADGAVRVVRRLLTDRYECLPEAYRRRLQVRHAWIALRMLPQVAAETRANGGSACLAVASVVIAAIARLLPLPILRPEKRPTTARPSSESAWIRRAR